MSKIFPVSRYDFDRDRCYIVDIEYEKARTQEECDLMEEQLTQMHRKMTRFLEELLDPKK